MKYGELPKPLGVFKAECKEMMFYQYLPIKMVNETELTYEPRLNCFNELIGAACCDFIGQFGLDNYVESYVYLTAKYMHQSPNCSFNRMGYHSDGFLTDDINYIWSDKNPTVFNYTDFSELGIPLNDSGSLVFMSAMANRDKEKKYAENTLLRLDQFNIHKVADNNFTGMRAFLKISISKDRYDLIGNSHNYLLDYDWEMRERKADRNIPQQNIKTKTNTEQPLDELFACGVFVD